MMHNGHEKQKKMITQGDFDTPSLHEAAEQQKCDVEKKEHNQCGSQPITLNIGGMRFETTTDTLMLCAESYFGAALGGRWDIRCDRDHAQSILFVDRDPTVFRHVLNHMRGYCTPLRYLSPAEIYLLKEDAEFYGLDGLIHLIEEHRRDMQERSSFAPTDMTIQQSKGEKAENIVWLHHNPRPDSFGWTVVRAETSAPSQGGEWSVRIEFPHKAVVRIGVAPTGERPRTFISCDDGLFYTLQKSTCALTWERRHDASLSVINRTDKSDRFVAVRVMNGKANFAIGQFVRDADNFVEQQLHGIKNQYHLWMYLPDTHTGRIAYSFVA